MTAAVCGAAVVGREDAAAVGVRVVAAVGARVGATVCAGKVPLLLVSGDAGVLGALVGADVLFWAAAMHATHA